MTAQQINDLAAALETAAEFMSRLSLALETGELNAQEAAEDVRETLDNLATFRP